MFNEGRCALTNLVLQEFYTHISGSKADYNACLLSAKGTLGALFEKYIKVAVIELIISINRVAIFNKIL